MTNKVSWAIKTLTGEHRSCGRLELNSVVTSEWLCRQLQSDIQANHDIPVESLQRLCMERYMIEVKKRLFYKVKAMCKERIHGGYREAYSLLPKYAEMVKETNPGNYALVSWGESTANQPPRFKAFFFSFAAQCRGFLRGCRPIIGIDGAHLSGHFKGILLTALGIDGNNEIFLIAYGVVGTESIDNWGYFLRNLKILFDKEGCSRDDWTFISDRMKGVDTSILETFPEQQEECVSSTCTQTARPKDLVVQPFISFSGL
ncbi:uncharacterized protein LOC110739372 [Chenopodium quinoa]|uniref:uncharacterized protein LOC110739372 n=1 Tax=Chenopodium quinoa TaxID=63459 RepID=UPI000B7910FD|nr:uncharacterized protein LOC110739372 [Chenopodium quinoa]